MSPRTGRPLKQDKKDAIFHLRLNEEEAQILDECAGKLKTTRSAALLYGLRMLKSELERTEEK